MTEKRFAATISHHAGTEQAICVIRWKGKHTKAQRDEFLRTLKNQIVKLIEGPTP